MRTFSRKKNFFNTDLSGSDLDVSLLLVYESNPPLHCFRGCVECWVPAQKKKDITQEFAKKKTPKKRYPGMSGENLTNEWAKTERNRTNVCMIQLVWYPGNLKNEWANIERNWTNVCTTVFGRPGWWYRCTYLQVVLRDRCDFPLILIWYNYTHSLHSRAARGRSNICRPCFSRMPRAPMTTVCWPTSYFV